MSSDGGPTLSEAILAQVRGVTPGAALAPLDSFQAAFCNGVYIAVGLFILFGVYSIIHSRLRPAMRRMISQLRDDRD